MDESQGRFEELQGLKERNPATTTLSVKLGVAVVSVFLTLRDAPPLPIVMRGDRLKAETTRALPLVEEIPVCT